MMEYRSNTYVSKWLAGEISGHSIDYVVSDWIRHYLIKKGNFKCWQCGWGEINPTTGKVPLELDHIDGDHTNCKKENFRVLCPNCHSLTPNYRALNKGNGRESRRRDSLDGKAPLL